MNVLLHHVKMIHIIQFMVCVVTANVVCLLISSSIIITSSMTSFSDRPHQISTEILGNKNKTSSTSKQTNTQPDRTT